MAQRHFGKTTAYIIVTIFIYFFLPLWAERAGNAQIASLMKLYNIHFVTVKGLFVQTWTWPSNPSTKNGTSSLAVTTGLFRLRIGTKSDQQKTKLFIRPV